MTSIASCIRLHLNALRVHNGDERQEVPEDVIVALACSPCSKLDAARLREVNEWIRGVVVYLEDTTIRSLKVAERTGLKSTDRSIWFGAVQQYVHDLQFPVMDARKDGRGGPGGEHALVVSAGALVWLLGHAVGLAYDDGVAGTQGYDGIMTRDVMHSGISHNADISDCIMRSDDVVDGAAAGAFGRVCKSLAVHQRGEDITVDDIERCIYRIEHEMLPFLTKKKAGLSLDDDEAIKQAIPLGFSTGDDAVDRAARVLRILHIKELRRLQNVVDDAITAHQNVTANPRTEAGPKRRKKPAQS